MNSIQLQGYGVTLKPITQSILEQLRTWRNSEHVRKQMLDQAIISESQQQKWFQAIQQSDTQWHFVIYLKDKAIGACNIKKSDDEADNQGYELGLYIGDESYIGNIVAFSPVLLMNDYCFEQLAASHINAVVKNQNTAALRYNQVLGYKIKTNSDGLTYLVLTQQDYEQATKRLKQLLNR